MAYLQSKASKFVQYTPKNSLIYPNFILYSIYRILRKIIYSKLANNSSTLSSLEKIDGGIFRPSIETPKKILHYAEVPAPQTLTLHDP